MRPFLLCRKQSSPPPHGGGLLWCSGHELFDREIQLVDGLLVAALHSVGQTVVDVIFQNDLRRVVQRRAHGCKLDEHLGTVTPILDHALDRLQMADRAALVCVWVWVCPCPWLCAWSCSCICTSPSWQWVITFPFSSTCVCTPALCV